MIMQDKCFIPERCTMLPIAEAKKLKAFAWAREDCDIFSCDDCYGKRIGEIKPEYDKQIWFDNIPTKGFKLVPDKERKYPTYLNTVRFIIQDPRGYKVDISTDDFVYIFRNCRITGDEIDGEFVYGWFENCSKPSLIPLNAPDYKPFRDYSQRLLHHEKISSANIVPNYFYENAKGEDMLYLGKFPCFEQQYFWAGEDGEEKTTFNWIEVPSEYLAFPNEHVRILKKGSSQIFASCSYYFDGRGIRQTSWCITEFGRLSSSKFVACKRKATDEEADEAMEAFKKSSSFPVDYSKTKWTHYSKEFFERFCEQIKRDEDYGHIARNDMCSTSPDLSPFTRYRVVYNIDSDIWSVVLPARDHSGWTTFNMLDSVDELYDWFQPCYCETFRVSDVLYDRSGYVEEKDLR